MRENKGTVLMCASIDTTPGGMHSSMRYAAEELRENGYSVESLLNSGFENMLFKNPKACWILSPYLITLKVLWKMISGKNIRLVEVHEPSAYVYCTMAKLLPFLPPCAVRSYGIEDMVFDTESHYKHFPGKKNIYRRTRYALNKLSLKLSKFNIAFNEHDRRYVEERYGITKNIILNYRIPSILFETAREREAPEKGECKDVYIIGPWTIRKGKYLIPEIVSKVLREDKSIKFVLIGVEDDIESVKSTLKEFLENVVIVPRFYGYKQLSEIFKEEGVLLCPAIHESGPIVVLEAMAFRKAVVCSKKCYLIEEIAKDQRDVIFVDDNDTDEYAKAVLELARDDRKRRMMVENGFRVAEKFSNENQIDGYIRMLES